MADNYDQSLGSISVSISKGSVYESGGLSMYDATLEDALGREEKSISNEVIRKGDTLLDTYTVEADAISGGMGSVWRVHHQSWNTDLAMKRPQPRFFSEGSQRRKENFIKECEAWINLGLHPNIVSCYYVREIGGVPTIFSEWMNNGSLKDRIRDGSLYEGTEAQQEERLLDLAIQFSRGLRYSHENGLIHRDVKPDNLLLTKEWDAKVSDFGLVKARDEALSEEGAKRKGGYTPEYCSSEQAAGREADARSDVYSWALSVLEMYTKERKWESGPEVSENLEQYINAVKLPLPEDLRGLLTRCLEADADKRPGDFVEIEATLHKIYKSETGNDYPRKASKAAADTADSLNNRALSMLDLGKIEQAERLWKAALAKDYICRDAAYNFLLYRHRTGSLHDDEVKEWLASLSRLTDDDSFRFRLCQLELECGRPMDVLLTLSGLHNKTDAVRKMAKYAAGVVESGDFPHMEWEKEDGDAPGAACLLAGGDIAFTSNRLSHANYLKRWDLTVGACVAKLSAPMGTSFDSLDFLRLSETERFILACQYNRMHLVEASSGIVHGSFGDVPDGKVDATSFSCDDRYLAAGIKGGVYIWDVETLEWVAEIPARGVDITSICFLGDGSMIIVAYDDKTLMIWDGADGGELSLIKTVNNVKAMRDYPDGKSICMVLTDGSVQRYWLCSGQTEVISEPGGGCTCERAAINRDCTLVVYGGRNKEHEGAGFYTQLKLIDTKTGRCYATFAAHYGVLCDIALSGDGRRAISIGTDNKLRLWNTTRVECSAEYILSGITDTRTAATRQSRVNAELREAKACISSAEYANALAALSRAEGLVEGYDYPDEYWNLKWAVFKNCKVEGVTSIVPITNIVVENKVLSQIVFTDDTTVALRTKDSIELYGMNGEHKSSIEFMKPDDTGGAKFESEPCIAAVSGGGLLFIAVNDDLWQIDAGTGSVTARTAAPGQVFCMATDAHMKRLFTLGYSGMYADRVHIYRADTFHSEIEFNVSAKDYSVDCIAVDKAGNELFVLYSGRIGERGLLRSYSAESGRLTNEYEVHKKRGGAYQADPAHDFLYFVGAEGHLSRVDFSGGIESITRIEVKPAVSLACSPDKGFIATCGVEGEAPLRIYSTEGAGRIFEIDLRHGAEIRDYELRPKFAAFSSDNRHIAVICGDKTVRILRLNWRLSAKLI